MNEADPTTLLRVVIFLQVLTLAGVLIVLALRDKSSNDHEEIE